MAIDPHGRSESGAGERHLRRREFVRRGARGLAVAAAAPSVLLGCGWGDDTAEPVTLPDRIPGRPEDLGVVMRGLGGAERAGVSPTLIVPPTDSESDWRLLYRGVRVEWEDGRHDNIFTPKVARSPDGLSFPARYRRPVNESPSPTRVNDSWYGIEDVARGLPGEPRWADLYRSREGLEGPWQRVHRGLFGRPEEVTAYSESTGGAVELPDGTWLLYQRPHHERNGRYWRTVAPTWNDGYFGDPGGWSERFVDRPVRLALEAAGPDRDQQVYGCLPFLLGDDLFAIVHGMDDEDRMDSWLYYSPDGRGRELELAWDTPFLPRSGRPQLYAMAPIRVGDTYYCYYGGFDNRHGYAIRDAVMGLAVWDGSL
jgi:hypothetical protein